MLPLLGGIGVLFFNGAVDARLGAHRREDSSDPEAC
jgi:hypothetical protein